ncbi:type II secretion system protein M [Lysobacter sp. GX 14042]|uniref:type II secretion system protein GspM n=1 Tax=Lysobacter sp. GX 14042 TaxID=2907155 RepID=UPI001F1F4EC4|nr:type II secretion system protein GspM [Lysobacter sp. GX 14042]MCE7033199.1 type II secretion system protein M [Lysobacter sp. GX 14042]
MSGRPQEWWRARAPRERLMLSVMFLAVSAFVGWFAVLAPLGRLADDAAGRHAAATALLAEVRAARAELAAFAAARPQHDPGTPFDALLARTAGGAGVAVSSQRRDGDRLTVGIDAVAAPVLIGWLDALSRQYGVAPTAMEVGERNGSLHAELAFTGPETAIDP